MKTCEHLETGDHVCVTTTKRGAPVIEGAVAEIVSDAIYLIASPDPRKFAIRIPRAEVANVLVLNRAPQAIYEQSERRFDYGMKITGVKNGARFLGEVISAWKGSIVIRTPKGQCEIVRAKNAFRAH